MIKSDGLPNVPKEAVYVSQLLEQHHVSLSLPAFFDQIQSGAQVLDCIVISEECDCLSCGFARIINCFPAFIGKSKVMCKQTVEAIQAICINGFHCFAHAAMEGTSAFDQNGFVDGLLCEGIAKCIFDLRHTRGF